MNIKQKGFTLIELLVVVSIIGVLTAVLLANFVGIRQRAADTSLKNGLRQLKTGMRLYYNDNQSYPVSSNGVFSSCSDATCSEGNEFNSGSGGTIYIKEVPAYEDYTLTNSGDGFTVRVLLNNTSDPHTTESAVSCGVTPTTGYFYVCAD